MAGEQRAWLAALGLVLLAWTGLVFLLLPSAASMQTIWEQSETYAHGYVVLPLSLWLVWRGRHKLMATPAGPDWLAMGAVVVISTGWLVARVAGVQVLEHYGLVGLAMAAVWLLLGRAAALRLVFPLLFLLFMVPNGEFLMEPLMAFTADFAIGTLRLIGIPVVREGTFFSIPSGDWSVVEACSGIRYVLSSLMLGTLYAYLTYRTNWKRVAFALASLVLPVLANGMRASMIVLLAHYSDMKLATGVDHIIYGWVWFGMVMLAMFWVGNFWREDEDPARTTPAPVKPRLAWQPLVALLAVVALFPAYARHLEDRQPRPSPLASVVAPAGWQVTDTPMTEWRPEWWGMDDSRTLHLAQGDDQAMLYLAWYGAQRQDAELINFASVFVHQEHPVWRKTRETGREVEIAGQRVALRQAWVDSEKLGQRLLVWQWNRFHGESGVSLLRTKAWLVGLKLTGGNDAGTTVILAAPYQEHPEEAEKILHRLANDLDAGMNAVLDRDGG